MFSYIVTLVFVGLVVGGLGRLVVPGPNPIGLGLTIVAGLVGAVAGTLVGAAIGVGLLLTFLLQIVVAAACVAAFTGPRRRWRARL